uniref:UBX domain-containing protein n=1 Tax=Strongyloides papillosus TaxID=174720 RepID=A0A0N5B8F6_STREA
MFMSNLYLLLDLFGDWLNSFFEDNDVSMEIYEEGMEQHQKRYEGILPDGDSTNSQEYCVDEPLFKKKRTLHDGSNVDEDSENTPPLNETFRGVPSSSNNNNTKVIKLEHYLADEFGAKILRIDPDELEECFENCLNGIYLNIKHEDGTVCKYELDITLPEIAVLVRRIIAKIRGHKRGDLKLITENSFYKYQLMPTEDDSLFIGERQLRRRKRRHN